jgi:hypothetical protein
MFDFIRLSIQNFLEFSNILENKIINQNQRMIFKKYIYEMNKKETIKMKKMNKFRYE